MIGGFSEKERIDAKYNEIAREFVTDGDKLRDEITSYLEINMEYVEIEKVDLI